MSFAPESMGFRMPAEFEKQEATWISWPKNKETWLGMLESAEQSFLEFTKLVSAAQKVKILTIDRETLSRKLKNNSIDLNQIQFFEIDYVDSWIRDYGPIFVTNKREKAFINWAFNAWGNRYDDLKLDNSIPEKLNKVLKLPVFENQMILEGGSIDVNGKGSLLTTSQCLLNKNRNPDLSREQIESNLKNYLGVSNILWLKEGIVGDDTDGHIDDIARFVNENTIVCAFEENQDDENYHILKENYELLQDMKDQDGNPIRTVKLPMPDPVIIDEIRLPASYTNFYIGNEVVAVPIFGCKKDQIALNILQELFPARKVCGVNSKELVYGFGALHCLSQQEPIV